MSHRGLITFTPPKLSTYLSDVYTLQPIVGKPKEEEVKNIHAVIRALNSVSHLPSLYDPELYMQLSQHLFDVQMAIYQTNYSPNPQPDAPPRQENAYVPPTLPPDIPGTLNRVVGAPSDEDIQSTQSILRYVESLSNSHGFFDADLSMKLSQHLFNLQFARHMQSTGYGRENTASSVPNSEAARVPLELTRLEDVLKEINETTKGSKQVLEEMNKILNVGKETNLAWRANTAPEPTTQVLPGLTRMEQLMRQMNETMNESKDILGNMNRVLISTQRAQSTVGSFERTIKSTVHMNPVNQRGELASECGLPLLRYWLSDMDYIIWMEPQAIAKYLKFFGIGTHLIRGADKPVLVEGKEDEAAKVLFKQIGLNYSGARYHYAQTS